MAATSRRRQRSGPSRARTRAVALALVVACGLGLISLAAPTAYAHVVPTSSVELKVGTGDEIEALVSVPISDLEAATGLDLGDQSHSVVDAHADEIRAYLMAHFVPTTDADQRWTVNVGSLSVAAAGDSDATGLFQQLQTTVTLTAPAGSDVRSFNLGYDAIVHKVATHVVIVTISSDWAGGNVGGTYQAGVVQRDSVTNTVQPLHLDLGTGSNLRGLASMVALGLHHIDEGTDHQLFLLTLLLPAPLLVAARRWSGPVTPRLAIRRIATITMSFTLGHSLTLALGALGLPVPQAAVEALIAVSILVAAAHAIRPLFPGREAVVAASFGLIHGLAFSEALRELDLTGLHLVLALLGFNLGIEVMQLIIVALVLPPLILLARSGRYQTLRILASLVTAVSAIGWLAARLGAENPLADLADQFGFIAVPVVVGLWVGALVIAVQVRRATSESLTRPARILPPAPQTSNPEGGVPGAVAGSVRCCPDTVRWSWPAPHCIPPRPHGSWPMRPLQDRPYVTPTCPEPCPADRS